MPTTHTQITIREVSVLVQPKLASRRSWLKGLSALLGTGLLATPTALLAAPAVPVAALATDPLPASDLVGGDEYISMVKLFTGTHVPSGWTLCDGRELPIAQHPVLFALLGTTYGGDGRHTFALPKLYISAELTPAAHKGSDALLGVEPAPSASPERICAIKTANAVATTTGVAELRLQHHYRPQANRVA